MAVGKDEANDFWENYAKMCSAHKIYPLSSIMKQKKSLKLLCAVKLIRAQHCSLILEALSQYKTLTAINFFADISEAVKIKKIGKLNIFPVPLFLCPKNIFTTCSSLKSCLIINQKLKILKLERLPLSVDHVKILSEGLKNCTSLQEFSLEGCSIGDDAAELLFENLKYVLNIHWVNVSCCDLSVKSAVAISSMLKFQSIIHLTEAWKESLRYSKPILDDSRGIDRISLNNNANFGDKAIEALKESLIDDLWLKALDLQKCNIGINGATTVLKILKSNSILEIVDLQCNNVSKEIQEQIDIQLSLNNAGKTLKYEALPFTMKAHSKRRVCSTGKAFKAKSSTKSEVEKLKISLYKEKKARKCVQDKFYELQAKYKLLREEMTNSENMIPEGFTLIDNLTYLEIQETFTKFSDFLKLIGETGLQDLMPSLKYTLGDQAHTFKSGEVLLIGKKKC